MGITTYALFAYGVTTVLSLAVTVIIVLVSKLTNKPNNSQEGDTNE